MIQPLNAQAAAAAPDAPNGAHVALAIGNSNYGDGQLVSGADDAKAVAQALHDIGFDVALVTDATLKDTGDAITAFKTRLASASAAVVFYSGHGFQVNGESYLEPTDGSINPSFSLPLEDLLQALGMAPNTAFKLVLIDACRPALPLPSGVSAGLAPPQPTPSNVVQSFAASPGQNAASGGPGALSPYTQVLVRHLREAGLTAQELLDRIKDELVSPEAGQTPTQVGAPPPGLCLRPAVVAQALVTQADDGLVVLLNGDVVINQSEATDNPQPQPLTLRAGPNALRLLVFNQRSFHNGQSWERAEGWGYSLELRSAGGAHLTTLAASEDVPFKDGPHHGHVFEVASADLVVDLNTAQLSLANVDTGIWVRQAPVWARSQDVLWEMAVKDLPLDQITVPGLGLTAASILQLIQGFKGGPISAPDLSKIFVTVRANTAFKPYVQGCMANVQARLADLNQSLAAALARNPTPFASFDAALTQCVQAAAAAASAPFQPTDIRVWTDMEDRSS